MADVIPAAVQRGFSNKFYEKRKITALEPEHQQLIVDVGALPLLVDLLKRHKKSPNSRAVTGVVRRAADALTNLAHENSSIKTYVRMEGGIPPLVELLEFTDIKVQKAAASALRTLAFKNDENKNQIVECNALPTLILMLRSEDAAIHYEADAENSCRLSSHFVLRTVHMHLDQETFSFGYLTMFRWFIQKFSTQSVAQHGHTRGSVAEKHPSDFLYILFPLHLAIDENVLGH